MRQVVPDVKENPENSSIKIYPGALTLLKKHVFSSKELRDGFSARLKKNSLPLAFLSPAVFFVLLITFLPILHAISVSFYETSYLQKTEFVGFHHYWNYLQEPAGRQNILNSLIYVFGSLILAVPFGVLLATLLHRNLRFRTLFRTLIILPWVVAQLISALLWNWLINPSYGPVNYFIQLWFGFPVDFLSQPLTAMPTLILANVWRSFPYPMLLTLAALQTIPEELLEAAKVDGASAWTRFWRITLPLIQNTLLIAIIMLSLYYFNMVTLPLVLTGGGPLGTTEVISLRVYREAFNFYHIGYGSAIAIYILLFNILFSLLYIKILRTKAVY
jgi:multiple sugar transport system permease protein